MLLDDDLVRCGVGDERVVPHRLGAHRSARRRRRGGTRGARAMEQVRVGIVHSERKDAIIQHVGPGARPRGHRGRQGKRTVGSRGWLKGTLEEAGGRAGG